MKKSTATALIVFIGLAAAFSFSSDLQAEAVKIANQPWVLNKINEICGTNVVAKIQAAAADALKDAKAYADDKTSGLATAKSVEAVEAKADANAAEIETKAATADVYSKTETYTKEETDAKVKAATPTDYATVKAKANSALQSESDPSVSAWAKSASKPSYSASEVGTYTKDEIDAKVSSATPGDYSTVKSNAASALSKANANANDITAIKGAGYVSKTDADTAYYPKANGDAWSAYWDGDDVRVTVTNYDSAVNLPSLYLEQRTNEVALATNLFRTVWRELAHWEKFLGAGWNWRDATWEGFTAWKDGIAAEIGNKADRAWGFYDSHTGEFTPDGYAVISASNLMIAAGMSYQKTVTTSAEVWVLTANEPYEPTGVATNGGFQIRDADGNIQFEIVKGDKVTVAAQAHATTVDTSTTPNTLVVVYNIEATQHPTLEVCLDLLGADWKKEGEDGCAAAVTWSGGSGAWAARITPTPATSTCFAKATYQRGGDTYINNRCAVGMSQLVLGGVTYDLGTAEISGKTVLTLTPAN